MKRMLFTIAGTVAGVVGLLGLKTHSPLSQVGDLPSAALPSRATSSPAGGNGAASSPPDPSGGPTAGAASRDFIGQAVQTRYGVVQVKITVQGSRITNVAFVQLTGYDSRSQQINSYASNILLEETLTAQNAQIDTVSGATYTSQGYIQSLQSALDQAGIR